MTEAIIYGGLFLGVLALVEGVYLVACGKSIRLNSRVNRRLEMLDRGLSVSVNSDDPSYFGGQLIANYLALARELGMTGAQALALVRGGFEGSLLSEDERTPFLAAVEATAASHGIAG